MKIGKTKPLLLFFGLIGAVFWNIPNTVSIFSGEHGYYNVTKIDCTKCHSDILVQLSEVGIVNGLHININSSDQYGCVTCHKASNSSLNSSEDYHSAFDPNCTDCHQNVSITIRGNKESHSILVTEADNSTVNKGINEACITCHTKVSLSINIRNRQVFAFENDSIAANETANGTPEFNGSYLVTIPGSDMTGVHNFRDNVSCVTCHENIETILNKSISPYPEHRSFGCEGCHMGSEIQVVNETNDTNITAMITSEIPVDYHASKIKYCSDCHGQVNYPRDCNMCHDSHGGLKV